MQPRWSVSSRIRSYRASGLRLSDVLFESPTVGRVVPWSCKSWGRQFRVFKELDLDTIVILKLESSHGNLA